MSDEQLRNYLEPLNREYLLSEFYNHVGCEAEDYFIRSINNVTDQELIDEIIDINNVREYERTKV